MTDPQPCRVIGVLDDGAASLSPTALALLRRADVVVGGSRTLALLDDERDPTMLAIRGDAQFALGDRAKARTAYAKALGLVDVGDPQHRLLQLKLIESGGTPPHTEDRT